MPDRSGFITFEGGEGSGKSTQIALLQQAFESAGVPTLVTREPGGTPLAEALREVILAGEPGSMDARCELFLYLAARHQHVAERIRPALEQGRWVLCDRYADATVAYQGYGRGMVPKEIEALATWGHDLTPDLTLLLDLPVAEGLYRVGKRGHANRLDREAESFHQMVYDGYRQLAADHPERIVLIDATGSPQQVHGAVLAAVGDHFGARLPCLAGNG